MGLWSRWLVVFLQVTPAAWGFRGEMTTSAYRVFGPSAPVSTLAGQIHQESAWQTHARSPVGAQGLAQFMPSTAADMAKNFPASCAPANPYSPPWAFGCRDRYMAGLLRSVRRPVPPGDTVAECSAWAFALRAYNGGLGWINRDRRAAMAAGVDADDWRAVRPFNAGRSAANHRENREYPERIYRLGARYAAAGWGRIVTC